MGDAIDPALLVNMTLRPPPPGVYSNFVNPQTLRSQGEIGMIFCIVVGAAFVALRFYVKVVVTKSYNWDDFWCLLAFIGVVSHDVMSTTMMGTGKGRLLGAHGWDIRVTDITKTFLQKSVSCINLYAAAALFVKLSLFCLYLRLFKVKRVTRWLIYGGIVACVIVYTGSVIINCIWFVPPPGQPQTLASWQAMATPSGPRSYHLAIFQGAFGTLSDIYLLAIPVQSILVLNLPLAKRIGVSMIFMTGVIAIACSIGSLVFRVRGLHSTDAQWDSIRVYLFSSAEVTAGIVCASIPVCAAMFRGERNTFLSFSRRYLSRLRRSEKSYGSHPGDLSGKRSITTIGSKTRHRPKDTIDSESVDDLFTRRSDFDGESGSIELHSVVVR